MQVRKLFPDSYPWGLRFGQLQDRQGQGEGVKAADS